MCGILGHLKNKEHNSNGVLPFLQRLNHRGPDDSGQWISQDRCVSLGHVRLSIQDLSPLGHQPMFSGNGRYVIVFNGEIYNFELLREQLRSFGHEFRSTGDTEVVLAAYQKWGHKCVEHFNGMFALAIFDQGSSDTEPSLFLARDRAGEKPLYYIHDAGQLQFASELKALQHNGTLSMAALNHYLALGYVPADQSLFEGVNKLQPAHCAHYCLRTGKLRIWRYWSLPTNHATEDSDGQALALEAGRLIEDSVRMRLVADVPVGVLLSGGLDSSLVAAAAARVSSRPVQTFTIALPGSPLDEAHHAQKVADFLGTQHHVLELDKPSIGLLDGLAPLIDEPIADSSILPAWLVFGLARQQVTVALGGDGGDELFGGYTSYLTALKDEQTWGKLPRSISALVARLAGHFPAGIKGRNKLLSMSHGPARQFIFGTPYFDPVLRSRLLKPGALKRDSLYAPEIMLQAIYAQGRSTLDKMMRMDFNTILPDDFLVKVDRASMAHSLEVRAPMLDHRLVEFCFSQVPDEWKVKDGESRRLQRKLAEHWLPPDLDTRRKQGFSIPVNEWLRAEGEAGLMARMETLPNVINMDEVRSLIRGHLAGRANGGRLFALIMLSIAMKNIQS